MANGKLQKNLVSVILCFHCCKTVVFILLGCDAALFYKNLITFWDCLNLSFTTPDDGIDMQSQNVINFLQNFTASQPRIKKTTWFLYSM